MKITLEIDDRRMLDELDLVNGTKAVSRARNKLRSIVRAALESRLNDGDLLDNCIDSVVRDAKRDPAIPQ
jgi:hypothetical protein